MKATMLYILVKCAGYSKQHKLVKYAVYSTHYAILEKMFEHTGNLLKQIREGRIPKEFRKAVH